MADRNTTEVFMRLVDRNGAAVPAECTAQIDSAKDDMAADFTTGAFFLVEDFRLSMVVEDHDATADAANAAGARGVGPAAQNRQAGPQVMFGKWKTAAPDDVKKMKYPVRMNELVLTRLCDRASPVLFEKCATSESFQSASLVKRKVIGDAALRAFFRLDFSDVLITHVSFADANVLRETIHLIFRKMTVQYKSQAADGRLGPAGSVAWEYDAGLAGQPKGR